MRAPVAIASVFRIVRPGEERRAERGWMKRDREGGEINSYLGDGPEDGVAMVVMMRLDGYGKSRSLGAVVDALFKR